MYNKYPVTRHIAVCLLVFLFNKLGDGSVIISKKLSINEILADTVLKSIK